MIALLLASLALAQSTGTLTITVEVVEANHVDTLPLTVNDTPVERWTLLAHGSQSEMTAAPCDECPPVRYEEIDGYDWSGYPYPVAPQTPTPRGPDRNTTSS